jgi:carboxylate-amine ligase
VLGSLVDARLAVRRLLAELEADLRERDEWIEVSDLVARLFARGTSAARQREIWLRTGDRREIAARMVADGVPGGS